VQLCVERRPVHRSVACSTVPAGVSAAAVPEARDVPDQYLIRAEMVSIRASVGRLGHPFTVGGPDQLTLVHSSVSSDEGRPIAEN
jgi:hypothetical protein